ncbi:hypothetical protein A1D29_06180 [Pasteurellaceae bacterium Orientalotternb1]|nr:hypothetical protein A1D29_06180 [Pasteurellaceae bacterium Orientalotternb1]
MERYLQQAETMPFTEKMSFVLALIEQDEIDERQAYQIITATGEPPEKSEEEPQGAMIDFL